jgi:uncharacterized protein YdeI (YjbR/CyaY-like superfamily)
MKGGEKPLELVCRDQWRTWLDALSLEEAVEEALCFGWIDGLLRSVDAETYLLRFSPRKRKSIWSESNKRRAEGLIRAGRMTAAGLEKIAEAEANGEWEAATAREDVDAIPEDAVPPLAEECEET